MSLAAGTRLGPYEILSAIGAGGMGEVYRARDSMLGRYVAIKVLPAGLTSDPDRLARFTREAQVLAALNHPNIAAIHHVEETADGPALVMELVDGETLADRIAHGPIPIDEALAIAQQIAEALEAAHAQGIVHRDLKPANVKITSGGTVKVLDFGLAKLVESDARPTSLTMSPTLSVQATYAGVILGTAAYMSPEQARGRQVDRRTDIWAFGCVLYEMLAGTRPFGGEDLAETIGAVIHKEPVWSQLPAVTPAAVRTVLQLCLQKDPKRRLRDIGDACLALDGAFDVPPAIQPVSRETLVQRRAVIALAAGTAILAGSLVTGIVVWFMTRPAHFEVTRTTIALTGPTALTASGADRNLALTPDGTRLVYVGNAGTQLFVRRLDALEPVAIASGTLRTPFVSPDGQWIGFVDNNTLLKKVAITGGPAVLITQLDGQPRGITWASDDTIIVATTNGAAGLESVPAAGGTATVLTRPDHAHGEAEHLWPEMLPGGRDVLFTITAQAGGFDAAQIAIFDLRTKTVKVIERGGSHAQYVASGHLIYATEGTLQAVPFDARRLEVRGTAAAVVPRVATTPNGGGYYTVATDGTLVYLDAIGGIPAETHTMVWVDREGNEEPIAAPPRAYQYPRISPDGTRVVVSITDQGNDLWLWDLRRETLTRLTFDPGLDSYPVWTRDGRRLIFDSERDGGYLNLWWQAADGSGVAERLTMSRNSQYPTGLASGGTQVVFWEVTSTTARDLLQLSLDAARRVTPILQTPLDEHNGIVSPDGHWLAYESNQSGRFEVYVRPFPDTGAGQWQISAAGGSRPLWAPQGKEMFYLGADGALMNVAVEASGSIWSAGPPMKLVDGRYYTDTRISGRTYDITPDGRRFLMIKSPGGGVNAPSPSVIVVQHFDEELKRLVPTK